MSENEDVPTPLNEVAQASQEEVRERIRGIIEMFVRSLVIHSHNAFVSYEVETDCTRYYIDIAVSDFGRLVGSKGKSINALRTLAMAMGGTYGLRVLISLKDEDKFF